MPFRRAPAFLSTFVAFAAILGCDGSDPAPNSSSTNSSGSGGEASSSTSTSNSNSNSSSSTGSGGMGGMGGGGMGGMGGGGMGGMGGAPPGCQSDSDCSSSSVGSICNIDGGACVECLVDTQCPSQEICMNHVCNPGCSTEKPCANGLSCCDGVCRDLQIDNDHCGVCNQPCGITVDSYRACAAGICAITSCKPYFYDCNANSVDGCEQTDNKNPCICVPGIVEPCYLGAPGTQGVGPCASGMRTCNADGLGWSECAGQVLPQWEICGNQIDEDCNGLVDDVLDFDGDGWTYCEGDCVEFAVNGLLVQPNRVNPGAKEFPYNGVDDDCDPNTSDMMDPLDCSADEKLTGVMPTDLVKAMDLCQFTEENLPLPQRKWGVIDAQFLLADGSVPSAAQLQDITNSQVAVLSDYGDGNIPRHGSTMAGLSTGMMRDTSHHGYLGPSHFSSLVNPPANYLAEVGGQLPHPSNCAGATMARDSVNLRFRVRIPTNVNELGYSWLFGSAESTQIECSPGDDFALGFMDPRPSGVPISFPSNLLLDYPGTPMAVNSTFFMTCTPAFALTCPHGPMGLAGTPMQRLTKINFGEAPVEPGTIVTFDFMVFDGDDSMTDSVLLLDQFIFQVASPCVRGNDPTSLMGDPLHCH